VERATAVHVAVAVAWVAVRADYFARGNTVVERRIAGAIVVDRPRQQAVAGPFVSGDAVGEVTDLTAADAGRERVAGTQCYGEQRRREQHPNELRH